MNTTSWKDIVELIGIAAIVASLIFVGLEMRQARDIAMSDGALANAANEIERYISLSENSDIWLRGNSDEDLNENEQLIFLNLVETAQATEFMEIARLRRVGADDIADTLTADFAAFLYENPGARRVWTKAHRDKIRYRSLLVPGIEIIDSQFGDTVKTHLTKLDQLKH